MAEAEGKTQSKAVPQPVKAASSWTRVSAEECPAGEHPLETAWSLWLEQKTLERKESADYMDSLVEIGTVKTVEEFLRLTAWIKKPSSFPRDYSLLCFRVGSKPMWEEFPDGGCWSYRQKRGDKVSDSAADRSWDNLQLACISEAFGTPDVVGCVLSSRVKTLAVSVWNTSNTVEPQVRFKVGERMREVLGLPSNTLMEYKDFQSSIKDGSTYRNATLYTSMP
eukprot:gb/GFBE01039151.1/.p1 GENE.gb/GFBE01039151.1/~~gb/GFBE01039151.1/.p1  ORF type:complete len:223 (+),score=51.36 gb/GFBE01039151.1/:1-669(+)